MIAFNKAKTMELNDEKCPELITEHERVSDKLSEDLLTEVEENVRKRGMS